MSNLKKDFKVMQNHLVQSGFVFYGSEIYGGLANSYDYGPLGALFIRNLKNIWWSEWITKEINNFPLDSKILMNSKVWEASGHLKNFSDPLIENNVNNKRYRADHIIEELFPDVIVGTMSFEDMEKFLKDNVLTYDGVKCNWGSVREFNLMFETSQGVVKDAKTTLYLRPETAQGIFVNFNNILRSTRTKIPFGVGQIGKSFRNEVTPGNFIFRTREFEQFELEYFVAPNQSQDAFDYYVNKSETFLKEIGLKDSSLRRAVHSKEELAHYAKSTIDLQFEFPFGWGELMGICNRGDFDLVSHSKHSGEKLNYLDPVTNESFVPYVIEPSIGVDRLALALLSDAFDIEELGDGESRIVLRLNPKLAPYQFAVLPLNKKVHSDVAHDLFKKLIKLGYSVTYDESSSIGKRYRRQDAIGTPYVITVIDETNTQGLVTIRYRDTMKQETINIDQISKFIE